MTFHRCRPALIATALAVSVLSGRVSADDECPDAMDPGQQGISATIAVSGTEIPNDGVAPPRAAVTLAVNTLSGFRGHEFRSQLDMRT